MAIFLRSIIAALACAGALTACAGVGPRSDQVCPAVATSGADVDAVRVRELRAAAVNTEAWTFADVAQVFAPEFEQVRPDGVVGSINDAVGAFEDGRTAPWAVRYDIVEMDVRVYGCDAASVVGLAEVQPRGSATVMRWRFTDTWRRENGAWLYARSQYVAVPRS